VDENFLALGELAGAATAGTAEVEGKMRTSSVRASAAMSAPSFDRIGVCWTRNIVTFHPEQPDFGINLNEWNGERAAGVALAPRTTPHAYIYFDVPRWWHRVACAEIHMSAATLRLSGNPTVELCVFTEASHAAVDVAMRQWTARRPGLAKAHGAGRLPGRADSLFDVVVPASDSLAMLKSGSRADASKMLALLEAENFRNKSSIATKMLSRIGRLLHLGRCALSPIGRRRVSARCPRAGWPGLAFL